MAAMGYSAGQPFGDPNQFTRSTGEDELDRANQWLRSQPWWTQIRGAGTGDLTKQQRAEIEHQLAVHGVDLPEEFHIDEGGNLNQKSRVKGRIVKGALIGGAALTGAGLAGIGPLAGIGGAAGGTTAAASAAPALGSEASILGATVPTITGSNLAGGIIAGGGGLAAGGGTAAGAAGVGSRILSTAQKLAPVLGEASASRQQANQARDVGNLNRFQIQESLPARRLATSTRASMVANRTPTVAQWGGPGSGLRGETVKFTGGFSNPDLYNADTRALADDITHQNLLKHLRHGEDVPEVDREGAFDKILGGAATGASILGAFGPRRRPVTTPY